MKALQRVSAQPNAVHTLAKFDRLNNFRELRRAMGVVIIMKKTRPSSTWRKVEEMGFNPLQRKKYKGEKDALTAEGAVMRTGTRCTLHSLQTIQETPNSISNRDQGKTIRAQNRMSPTMAVMLQGPLPSVGCSSLFLLRTGVNRPCMSPSHAALPWGSPRAGEGTAASPGDLTSACVVIAC